MKLNLHFTITRISIVLVIVVSGLLSCIHQSKPFDPLRAGNEGSVKSPVLLALDSSHHGRAGDAGNADELNSYYVFTTDSAGSYRISVTAVDPSDANLDYYLYSDSLYETLAARDEAGDNIGLKAVGLAADKRYFLRIQNRSLAQTKFYIKVFFSPEKDNAGTPAIPVPVALDSLVSGHVGRFSPEDTSYYRFQPRQPGVYAVRLDSINPGNSGLVCQVYKDEVPQNIVLRRTNPGSALFCWEAEGNGADYRLMVINSSTAQVSYRIQISLLLEGTALFPLRLPLDSVHAVSLPDPDSLKDSCDYYQFLTQTAGVYAVDISGISPAGITLNYRLFSDSIYSKSMAWENNNPGVGLIALSLQPNNLYYLKISNLSKAAVSFSLVVRAISDGLPDAPVVLREDSVLSGKLYKNGYYKFYARQCGCYHLTASNVQPAGQTLLATMYIDSAFKYYYFNVSNTAGFFADNFLGGRSYSFRTYAKDTVRTVFTIRYSLISEGLRDTPVRLFLDSVHNGTVGLGRNSYYQFHSTRAGNYRVLLTQIQADSADTGFGLAAGGRFKKPSSLQDSVVGVLERCRADADTTTTVGLGGAASAKYVIRIQNAAAANQGSIDAPMGIPLWGPLTVFVGPGGISYYKILPNIPGPFDMKFSYPVPSNATVDFSMYSDSTFQTQIFSRDSVMNQTLASPRIPMGAWSYLKVFCNSQPDGASYVIQIGL